MPDDVRVSAVPTGLEADGFFERRVARPGPAADLADGLAMNSTNSVASLVNRLSLLMGPCFQPRVPEQPSPLPDFRRRSTAQTEVCRFRAVERDSDRFRNVPHPLTL